MPWIVDGMNVIGSRPDGWWRDRHAAMVRLVDRLERWAAAEGEDVTVMFEGPPRPPIRSSVIDVAHATRHGANAADHEIVRRIDADENPSGLRVVTSDRVLADQARARGAAVHPAESFRNEIDPKDSL
ncbi:MAG TPA: NYN domain-containing protein [Solirubrobacteraceae bacterium]|nr:NYN domain-containing protein [Solirubrobacteraceae bacterium]